MKSFKALPIKYKLIVLLFLISFGTLSISSALFIYNDLKFFKSSLVKNLAVLAGTIGANSRAAVYFEDQETASKILSSLNEESQVQHAALYDSKGNVFATFEAGQAEEVEAQSLELLSFTFKDDMVELKRPILLKNQTIGEIHLTASLTEFSTFIDKYLILVALIIIGTLCASLLISMKLQGIISKPILNLANKTQEISDKGDFSIRVQNQYEDELGVLYSGFNNMISNIEKRDLDLVTTNTALKNEVNQRRQAEMNLKIYSNELRRSNQELHDFAHIASHDLQEPLRKIITFSDRLSSTIPDLGTQAADYITRMQNAALRMQNFIKDLLKYSSIEAKAKEFSRVDLNTVVHSILEDLEIKIQSLKAKVVFKNLPEIEANPFYIRQLLLNLIGNSLKFHREDEPPEIHISCNNLEGLYWEIVVSDNGVGFDEKYLDRIFRPFERLHSGSEYEGTGIGLAICKKIAAYHDGTIRASSNPNKGTTFYITIPQKPS